MKKFIFKGVLLDLDNTLYDYNISHEAAKSAVIDHVSKFFELSRSSVAASFEQACLKIKENLSGTAAAHNRLLYFQSMLEILSINALKEGLILYDIYWNTFFEHMILYPDALNFLEYINKKYKICLVTDLTAHIQYRKIHKLGISDLINFIVTSEEVGKDKPHHTMFAKALEKLNLNANEVCMIGDNFQKDILGAMSHGIQSFWLTGDAEKILCFDQSKLNGLLLKPGALPVGDGSTSFPRARQLDGARPEPVEGCEFQKRSNNLVMPFSSFKELLGYLP